MTEAAARTSELGSWAASLGFLSDSVAPSVEMMCRRLSLAMVEDAPKVVGAIEPNGYGGLSGRGDLGRLLMSDWALADAEPMEFMRRFVQGELSFLELEYEEPRPASQLGVLVDSGPDQLGARRLAQLAGLVVLDRRARALGIPLMLGVIGNDSFKWSSGDLPELFEIWLRSRCPTRPDPSTVQEHFASMPSDASLWLFGGGRIPLDGLSRRVRRLSAVEVAWGPHGATHLEATVDLRPVVLPLPDGPAGVTILRGGGLRRRQGTELTGVDSALRFPRFHGPGRRLLFRGSTNDELVVVPIPQTRSAQGGRSKRRVFQGPVLAASVIGKRTVALVAMDGGIQVGVIGKSLGSVETIDVEPSDMDLTPQAIELISGSGLEPLYFRSGSIIVRLDGRWWSIDPPATVTEQSYVSALATRTIDQPRLVEDRPRGLYDGGRRIENSGAASRVLLGQDEHTALELDPGEWRLVGQTDGIKVDPDATVWGLTVIDKEPTLVVQSPSGQLLRLARSDGSATLTGFSTNVAYVEVHPTLPLAAIQRSDGSTDVVDLESRELLSRIQPEHP